MISAIDGMGGVGKSTLAIHAAHRLADVFVDGQIYVDLHGTTPGLVPLSPIKALEQLLGSLGMFLHQMPLDVDAAAARWRSLVANRRLLIVLDNAVSSAQVTPLLPGSSTCMVLVTSRRPLTMLGADARVYLDLFSQGHALELLNRIVGPERIDADPDAAADIIQLCGFLPLALQLAGARLAARRDWSLRRMADRLSATRLDELVLQP